ncbi:MAG TPA: aromatic ring-hydroxylating dioxygenase subunit alpha [Gaiellaceae bacterium]|nr:aromatic ring-hydroxylating dioxygenase subunit alpha [Gaiellaceae bacterium]
MEHTLPYSWYSNPEILRREQRRIFRSAWQYAGHLGQLPEKGTFFTGRAGRIPVVVTRARDGELRAFLNVCRHRGFPVAAGEGKRETLQCPYHAWTYGLDGSLRAAPRSEEDPAFCKDELALVPAAVDTWGPFIFVNAGPDPEPLAAALGSMPAQVAELGLDVGELRFTSRWEAEVDANWKIVCENFLECYHCQTAHPALAEVLDVSAEAYALAVEGRLSSQRGPIRDSGRDRMRLDGELPRSQFHFLWPNLTVNIFPGRPNISIGPVVPLTPERSYRFLDYFFGPDVDQAWIDDLMAFDDQVGSEDRVLVEGVQRGVASGALEHGHLLSRSEQLIGHFQQLTSTALGGLERSPEPL